MEVEVGFNLGVGIVMGLTACAPEDGTAELSGFGMMWKRKLLLIMTEKEKAKRLQQGVKTWTVEI